MQYQIHDMVDDALLAFDTEGVSEEEVFAAIASGLARLAEKKLGHHNELTTIFVDADNDIDLRDYLEEFNKWESPNSKDAAITS